MKQQLRQNRAMVILVFLCYCIIPHLVLCVPNFDPSQELWVAGKIEPLNAVLFFLEVSSLVSFMGGTLAFWHFLCGGTFSPLLILEAAVCLVTLLPRMPLANWLPLIWGLVFFAIMECFTLLNRAPFSHPFLADLQTNRKYLGWVCYLSTGMQLVCLANLPILGGLYTVPVLILALFLGILPYFQAVEAPMTSGGLAGTGLLAVLALLMTWYWYQYGGGPSAQLMPLVIIPGLILLFLGQGICHLLRRSSHRPKLL